MPEHVHLLVVPFDKEQSRVSRFLARVKQPTSRQIKVILVDNNSSLVEQLTVQARPGKRCFRFWQEGPGFDRNKLPEQVNSLTEDDKGKRTENRSREWKRNGTGSFS